MKLFLWVLGMLLLGMTSTYLFRVIELRTNLPGLQPPIQLNPDVAIPQLPPGLKIRV